MIIELYILFILIAIALGLIGFFTKQAHISIIAMIFCAILSLSSFSVEKSYCGVCINTTNSTCISGSACAVQIFNYGEFAWLWGGLTIFFFLFGAYDMLKQLLFIRKHE